MIEDWLYVSKRMHLTWFPDGRAMNVVEVGSKLYFRLTLPVLVWLERAVEKLEEAKPDAATVAVIVAALDEIYQFVRSHWSEAEVDKARAVGPKPLPEPEWVPTF